MREFTMGSLFAGIGGFDLGFERAGFTTKWQVEIDPFAQKVLAKNFPNAQRFGDIRTVGAHNLEPVDVICGGFPCQDISNAGKRAGIEGARSGLVTEGIRVIRELRPRFVLLENVAALLARGLGEVLGYLAEIGYDAEWHCIPASYVGARTLRDRIWIMAYPQCIGIQRGPTISETWCKESREEQLAGLLQPCSWPTLSSSRDRGTGHGIPNGIHRNKSLGNAVVPQIPELFARRIRAAMEADYA